MIQFLEQISFDLGLEFFAAVLGVLSVWYAKNNKILVYPTGIISTLIYVWILFKNLSGNSPCTIPTSPCRTK